MYNNNLDNQHSSMRNFVRRWFGPYMVKSSNNNATYHLVELNGTRLATPIAKKKVKIFKKQHQSRTSQTSTASKMKTKKGEWRSSSTTRSMILKTDYLYPHQLFSLMAHARGCAIWWGWKS